MITGLGTLKSHVSNTALSLRTDGAECQLVQAQLAAYRFSRGVVAEIAAQAREHGIVLPDIFIHVNRDGNLALATGAEPTEWPEGMIMVRSVEEVSVTNWQVTGSNVLTPQYQFDLEIKWTDSDGNPHVHSDTYLYPNDITAMPLNVRRCFAEEMIIAAARVALGINEWDDYA